MTFLFGREYSSEELRQLTGSIDQIAGVRLYTIADGRAIGMRAADVYTGSGFRFQVLLDRALDIGAVEHNGRALAWTHPALGGPNLYEPEGYGWVRTFGGGLLTTCGLTNFGQPEQDGSEALGLHGRISHASAEHVNITTEWRGDEYVLEISGQARQTRLFGENLLLKRKIMAYLGSNYFAIEDTVRNEGFRPTPHMILYHCNFGFPVVAPGSELLADLEEINPRDDAARAGIEGYTRFDEPNAEYAEQVFFHKPRVSSDGWVAAAIVNRQIPFGGYLRYRAAELPYFAQWKMMGAGDYVCALEPANQWETPRKKLREEGRLKLLAPGEEIHYRVELGALPGVDAISRFEEGLGRS